MAESENNPGLVSKDRDPNLVGNPIFVRAGDGTLSQGYTGTSANVAVVGSVTVTATQLDVDDLSAGIGAGEDNVLIFANTVKDGSGTDYVPLVDADGKLIISNPGGTEYSEDVATPAVIVGTATMIERDDVITTVTPVEGDWIGLRGSAEGALWVQDFNSDAIAASLVDIETNTNFGAVVGGGVEATALRVTIASDSTGLLSIDDNGGSITVDGTVTVTATQLDVDDLNLTDDAVRISGNTSANSETNPIFVQVVEEVASGNEVHSYEVETGLAADTTANHDYTAVGTFHLQMVTLSATGAARIEVINDAAGTPSTERVAHTNGRQGDYVEINFKPALEVATGDVLRLTVKNRQGAVNDIHSSLSGYDV